MIEPLRQARSTADELGAFVDAGLDKLLHLGELRRVGQRTEHRLLVQRIAHDDPGRRLGRQFLHFG